MDAVYIMENIINPRQVAIVSSRAHSKVFGKEEIRDNMMTVAWHTPLSFKPMMYAVAISKKRYTYELIHSTKVFAVNFLGQDMQELAIKCGSATGRYKDKWIDLNVEKEECHHIDCPRLKDASAWLECEVVEEVETGDHVLFIGRVAGSGCNSTGKRLLHLGGEEFGSA